MAQSSPYRRSEKATDPIKKVADRAEGLASTTAGQMRQATDQAGEVVANFKAAIDKSLRDQPMATLAVAAAVGFVLGALWKS